MSKAKKPLNGDHLVHTQALLAAEGLGSEWEIVVANDNELQLDFDGPIPERFIDIFSIFTEQNSICGFSTSVSRSGKGKHIRIFLTKPMLVHERIAWQACMGSDAQRDALSLISVAKGWLNPILLFERRDS